MRSRLWTAASAVVTLVWATAQAAPPASNPEQQPVVNGGRQVGPAPAVTAEFERLRAATRIPTRRGQLLAPGPAKPFTARGRLYRYVDGIVVLATTMSPSRRTVLERAGARQVFTADEIRHHTIFEGDYYQELPVAPPAGQPCAGCAQNHLTGPDPDVLRARVGKDVRFELRRDTYRRAWVVAITK